MIQQLFQVQLDRLAEALSCDRGTTIERETTSLQALSSTIAGSVTGIFKAAGLRPQIAELAAKAYAAGWTDGAHREMGISLPDGVHQRLNVDRGDRIASETRLIG